MLAWVLRFGLFAYGDPLGGLWMIILSCIVYGMAFDFFNISGSLFVETTTDSKIRSSAQGLFMMMSNGFGALLGAKISAYIIDKYYTIRFNNVDSLLAYFKTDINNKAIKMLVGNNDVTTNMLAKPIEVRDWHHIWLTFAIYALVIAVLFGIFFKHKHDPKDIENVVH